MISGARWATGLFLLSSMPGIMHGAGEGARAPGVDRARTQEKAEGAFRPPPLELSPSPHPDGLFAGGASRWS